MGEEEFATMVMATKLSIREILLPKRSIREMEEEYNCCLYIKERAKGTIVTCVPIRKSKGDYRHLCTYKKEQRGLSSLVYL